MRPVLPDQSDKRKSDLGDSNIKTPAKNRDDGKPARNPVEISERLGFGLRSMYRSVLEEPLPDDMMALLDQLSEIEENGNNSSQSSPDQRG